MKTTQEIRARLVLTLIALMCASCTGQRATYAPDGRRGFVITCSGLLNGWSSCLVKAGRACGKQGYETLQGTEEDRSMLIACK